MGESLQTLVKITIIWAKYYQNVCLVAKYAGKEMSEKKILNIFSSSQKVFNKVSMHGRKFKILWGLPILTRSLLTLFLSKS